MSEPTNLGLAPAPVSNLDHFFQLADAWLPFLGGLAGAFIPGAPPVVALVEKLDAFLEAGLKAREAVAGEPYNPSAVGRIA